MGRSHHAQIEMVLEISHPVSKQGAAAPNGPYKLANLDTNVQVNRAHYRLPHSLTSTVRTE